MARQAVEGAQAMQEYLANIEATRRKTAHLKAARLARDAARPGEPTSKLRVKTRRRVSDASRETRSASLPTSAEIT